MPRADQVMALLRSHFKGDEETFTTTALQLAAHEARQGHVKIARELRALIDRGKESRSVVAPPSTIPIAQARGDLAQLVSVTYPTERLSSMVLTEQFRARLDRVVAEQRQSEKIESYGLSPRRKLLLVGPPGSGKTLTASALAGELQLPLFTILLEGLITKYLGETAAKLRLIFESMARTRAVFLFDEFDAIGARRNASNDVGEIRRVLNSFLQLMEHDQSSSMVICATNHPELLDKALFRRFDDVLEYALPSKDIGRSLFRTRLSAFNTKGVDWNEVLGATSGLSQADIVRSAQDAAKSAILSNSSEITTAGLLAALEERGHSTKIG